ncbi:hypothetical protein [Helicobacter ganmani]|uniref:Secreted protein n=1 Tax=Helicobacter ganmani TaxID=60246 RepID=A0A3D8IB47_9HELI|nr:hypothetical protein [Helicobacter ganmani]RDU62318.1 hypothetical protein CQA43_06915 [Helicobacter ganmani]
MRQLILKISYTAILLSAYGNVALAQESQNKSCCTIAGSGGFTLSEEDKASLQENQESQSQKTNDQPKKEKE